MQPDGTLNPIADPSELPDPSDSGRVLLAGAHDLGARRGVRGLPRRAEPATRTFAAFLKDRLDLAVGALQRQPLVALRHLPADRRHAGAGLAGRRRRRRQRRGRARPVRVRRGRWRRDGGARRAGAAVRGHRPDGRRRRAQLAVRRGAAVGALAVDLARLGLADAGRAGPCLGSAGRHLARRPRRCATRRRSTRGCSRPAARTTAGCPPGSTARRSPTAPTRALQSLLATADVTGLGRRPAAGRHRRGLVLRRERLRPAGVRPGHRADRRRHRRPTAASTTTAAPSRPSTGCSRCSRSTPPRRRRDGPDCGDQ